MAEDSWPSPNHSAGALTDLEYEKLAISYAGSGLVGVPTDNPLIYGDSSGMQVKARLGRYAMVRGFEWYSGAVDDTVAIAANSSGSTRVDYITLRLDRSTSDVRLHRIAGTPGSGAPSLTQDVGTTGVWDLPLATVTVANGAATITAGNVTPKAWYLGAVALNCTSATRPPAAVGLRIYETDTGTEYTGNGSSFVTSLQDSGWVNCSVSPGWSATGVGAKVRKVNGIVYSRIELSNAGGSIAANTGTQMGTVPSGYRPDAETNVTAFQRGGDVVYCKIYASGAITAFNFPAAIANSDYIVLSSAAWPAA